jgi:hypothetical protein
LGIGHAKRIGKGRSGVNLGDAPALAFIIVVIRLVLGDYHLNGTKAGNQSS